MNILKEGSKGSAVIELQKLLTKHGITGRNKKPISIDGDFGENTEYAVIQFQKKQNLKVDGLVGDATLKALRGENTNKLLKESDLVAGAKRIGVPVTVIKAIAEVETMGTGFLDIGKPKILFERHRMYFYLVQKFGKVKANQLMANHPNIVNTKTGGYHGGSAEYTRLSQAKQLDIECALQSASWGRFQLMGENWKALGYPSVQEFVAQHEQNESLQFEAFLRYCETKSGEIDDKHWKLIDALRQENWHVVFSLYNGKNYKKLGYDTKFLRVMNRLDPSYQSSKAA
ncbi:N-acetylmuramidase domain-containing protein [Acinetobacter silvestris]|uniref:Hydrolase n=1 Tax=Acinetobacter silvestris TaxID=1977882 RepID=A0A1Y3CFR0_9GAMM|nr:N-acetylmuramidase family protein [Acinetobacter silvestris]OTG65929.1 hydrolase [Acinetobacter silvestris]